MDNLSKILNNMSSSINNFNIDTLIIGEKVYFINKNKLSSEGQVVNRYENCFAISILVGQDNYIPVTINETVHYLIVHKDQAFNCSSQVLGCKLEDGFQLAVLSIPHITNKIERRKQPRLPLVMSIDYFNLPEFTQYNFITQVPSVYFKKMKKTFTIDLSSTGIKIVTYKESDSPKNAILSLFIEEKIDILASIVRVDFDEINNDYKTAFEFKDMDKNKWTLLNKFLDEKSKNL
jgi:c-di-GMP-binding flagellar brake protein YcgR